MRKKRVVLIIIVTVLVLVTAGLAFAGNFFYNYALTPRRSERAPGVPDGEVAGTSEEAPSTPGQEWFAGHAEQVFMQSHDGLQLSGYLAGQTGHRYAIVVHGYTGNAQSMSSFGKHFYDLGFTVLMPDCRGHGNSEGDYIGMGWPDRLDILQWIDTIIREDPHAEIMLFGISMGGATVMMTAGEALPDNVKLVIEDCGYTSVWDEFAVQLKEQFNLPTFPILNVSSLVTKLRAGYTFKEASALEQVAKAEVPMLFIHGDADTYVPFWMLEPLYEAKSEPKAKLVVPGAGHGGASHTDPEGYWEAVDSFVDEYM